MTKTTKLFFDIQKELDWLAAQKGKRLVKTNGIRYVFERSENDYVYEYVYFEKSKKELPQIMSRIEDKSIELVCNTSSWALMRKDASLGSIQVYTDSNEKHRILMKKYGMYMALGSCYICLGASNIALYLSSNSLFAVSAVLFFISSSLFFLNASIIRKYAKQYGS